MPPKGEKVADFDRRLWYSCPPAPKERERLSERVEEVNRASRTIHIAEQAKRVASETRQHADWRVRSEAKKDAAEQAPNVKDETKTAKQRQLGYDDATLAFLLDSDY
ncbi:hypothetical protein Dda_2846 [Drechslerella dactyloides]|uniref:Uncharacterized protein n=1 Tax=Drechslerella dactyloides TaxID=74499 RepID=A0AAD6NM95_DREDA|nr:hypothetical protein Dda_2846 [Drechslerella dactyloides]